MDNKMQRKKEIIMKFKERMNHKVIKDRKN